MSVVDELTAHRMFVQQPASQSHMSLPSKMLQVVVSRYREKTFLAGLCKDVEETNRPMATNIRYTVPS